MGIQSFRILLEAYKNLKKKIPQKIENCLYYTYKIMSSISHQISIFGNNINKRKFSPS